MQALFQLDMNGAAADDEMAAAAALQAAWQHGLEQQGKADNLAPDEDFALALVQGTRGNLAEIDRMIMQQSKGWRISRMAVIDRSILRLAVYELCFMSEVGPGVVINEAVELAKRFGTDESSRFVNGILGAIAGNK